MSYEGYYYATLNDPLIKATANSSGVAVGYYGPCPEGFCWYVERYTTNTNSSGTPIVEVYVLNIPADATSGVGPDKSGRQDYSGSANNDTSDNVNPVYLRGGQYLVARWSSCNSGDKCQLSMQLRVHQISPVVATPIDRAQLVEGGLLPVGPVGPTLDGDEV